jgi:hypothetical protein
MRSAGRGVFRLALAGAVRLARRNLLPLITIVRTWDDDDELATLAAFARVLSDAGCGSAAPQGPAGVTARTRVDSRRRPAARTSA